jgi:hypothetical protein
MRLDDLQELTTLPGERLGLAFRSERVLAVLPVSEPSTGQATVLVATPTKLGVVTLSRRSGRDRWVTRWAPWDAVRLGTGVVASAGDRSHSRLRAAIRIGGHTFHGVLSGRPGRAALSDFALAVRSRREALSLPGGAAGALRSTLGRSAAT